jgi:hypothetical protein
MSLTLRVRQAGLLIPPLARAVPWLPPAAATGLAVAATLPAFLGAPAPAAQVWGLRITAALLGAGASFAMVDPMAPLTLTPTPRWLRQWLRFTVVLIPAAAVWTGLYLLAAAVPVDVPALPTADLVAEAVVCYLSGLAGAAAAARVGHTMTTALAGPATQGALLVATLFLTGENFPWPLPGAPGWADVHAVWWWSIPVLVAALLAANRDVWPLVRRRARAAGGRTRGRPPVGRAGVIRAGRRARL